MSHLGEADKALSISGLGVIIFGKPNIYTAHE